MNTLTKKQLREIIKEEIRKLNEKQTVLKGSMKYADVDKDIYSYDDDSIMIVFHFDKKLSNEARKWISVEIANIEKTIKQIIKDTGIKDLDWVDLGANNELFITGSKKYLKSGDNINVLKKVIEKKIKNKKYPISIEVDHLK